MEIVQVVGLALAATIIIVLIRQQKPEFALLLSIMTGTIIVLSIIGKLVTVFSALDNVTSRANVQILHLNTLFRIIGIAYIAEFGSQICRDAGEGALASKIELVAKVTIMVMAIPIIVLVLDTVLQLIP